MAPEQARGEELDIRADLYALGATLYHAVTGQTPFSGSSAAVMHSHLKRELPPPETINPNLTPGCVAIIKKLMAKERKDRYATPAVALEDVTRLLRGEQPLASVPAATPVVSPRAAIAGAEAVGATSAPPRHGARRHQSPAHGEPRQPRQRPPLWSIILLISGILWVTGILLMIWFVQDMRRHQQPVPTQSEEQPSPPAPASKPLKPRRDEY
jgi:serine/threonine-protein kinase